MDRSTRALVLVVTLTSVLSVLQRALVASATYITDAAKMRQDSVHMIITPEIENGEKNLILPKGSTRYLYCKSDQPIVWVHAEGQFTALYGATVNIEVEEYEAISRKKRDKTITYQIRKLLSNVSAENVGFYYCIHRKACEKEFPRPSERDCGEVCAKKLDKLVAEDQASSVYVYVDDPEHPLVPIRQPLFFVEQYENLILPCKPTHPSIVVELYRDTGSTLVEDVEYSVTQGYRLHSIRLEDGGIYHCQVKGSPENRTVMNVSIDEPTKNISNPTINSETRNVIPIGESVRLVCKVNYRAGIGFRMAWITPTGQDKRVEVRPLNMTSIEGSANWMYAWRELIIYQVTLADSGRYQCEVGDNKNNKLYQSFNLAVIDAKYLKLSAEYNKYYSVVDPKGNKPTPPIDIAFEYWSLPSSMSFYWKKDDDQNISEHNIAQYAGRYELNRTDTHIILKIVEPTVYETGNYTIHVSTNYVACTRQVVVGIRAKPIVQMDSKFAKPGENVTFTCRASGCPSPDISFLFSPCREWPYRNCPHTISKTSSEWDHPDGKYETEISNSRMYTFIASQPGVMHCRANNSEGSRMTSAQLYVSPMTDGVTLQQVLPTRQEIIVGDQLTIVCSALVYNHTKEISLELNGRQLRAEDGVNVVDSKEKFAWQVKLTIDNVTHEHNGLIKCKASTIHNVIETRTLHVQVHDPVAPRLLSGISNKIVLVDLQNVLILNCDIDGTPKPIIMWLKNNRELKIDENDPRMMLTKKTLTFHNFTIEDYGNYTCRGTNMIGTIERNWKVEMPSTSVFAMQTPLMIYGIIALLIVVIILMVVATSLYCKKMCEVKAMKEAGIVNFKKGNLGVYNPDLALDEQADLLPYNSEYEFPKDRLKLGQQLGTGAFGVVMMATATRIMVHEDETTVAVKMVKKQTDNEVLHALISELKIMVYLGQHLNVVNLLGAVTKNIAKRELMLIVEYCRYGNVQHFLQKHRPYIIDQIDQETQQIDTVSNSDQSHLQDRHSRYECAFSNESMHPFAWNRNYNSSDRSVNTTDLICWASQVASGMQYLSSRKVLHGDLAARNILLCDNNVVKICDFGLSHSIYRRGNYKKQSDVPLPFKWLALECISDNVFSTFTDVWAYGIVLWELFSLGKMPYPGMDPNQDLYNKLCDGYRMDKPQYSNRDIYDIMLNCWNVKPDSRPTFHDLNRKFDAMLPEDIRDHCSPLDGSYLRINTEKFDRNYVDHLVHLSSPEELAPTTPKIENGNISVFAPTCPVIRNEEEPGTSSKSSSGLNGDHSPSTSIHNHYTRPIARNKRNHNRGLQEKMM